MTPRRLLAALIGLALLLPAAASAQDPSELVFLFQKQKDPAEIQADADELARVLSEEIGVPVRAVVPGDYSASVRALIGEKADVAYVSSLPFLLARRDGDAELLLAEVREDTRTGEGRTDYDSIIVARKDSGIESMADVKERAGDLRFAFTSPTSTSGYVFAVLRLVREGILEPRQDPAEVFDGVMFGGGYSNALQAVADGKADVAAVSYYTMEGASADEYLDAETRDTLRVIARTPGVPTHLVAARGALSEGLKGKVKAALLKVSEERPELLADVYGAKQLVEVDEAEHVAATVEAVDALPGDLEDLAK